MNIEVIGISGKAGSGKDFVGRTVLRPAGFHQWAFAWPMKTMLVGRGQSYDDVFEHKPPAVRKMLQIIGTEEGWMTYGREYWTRQATAWLRTLSENLGLTKFYFTDVRFDHEVEWVRSFGGKLVRLEHGDRTYPLAGTEAAAHQSETALDGWQGWDLRIVNDQSTTVADLDEAFRRADILPRRMPPSIGAWIDECVPLTRRGGVLGRHVTSDGEL